MACLGQIAYAADVCSLVQHQGSRSPYIDNVKNHVRIDVGLERTHDREEE